MAQPSDGGPAFPHKVFVGESLASMKIEYQGMSLRDWFAGRAVNECLVGAKTWAEKVIANGSPVGAPDISANAARHAYLIADAMLAAREVTDAEA